MWESLVGSLLGKFSETAATVYIERKRLKHEIKMEQLRGKAAYEKAKTRRASESEGRDADWESESIHNSGWKDEMVIIILSIPMVAVFVPGLEPYIKAGFVALESTPDWYRWLVVMIYAATFGIRVWRRKL
jgi:hypothetical protein